LTTRTIIASLGVNVFSLTAGALCLVSIFLPWWGIQGSFFGITASATWSLWGQPSQPNTSPGIAQLSQALTSSGNLILVLVFVAASISLLGSFTNRNRYPAMGFVLSILILFLYAGAVKNAIVVACQNSNPCISNPTGTASLAGNTVTWGFQAGFYLFLVAAFLLLAATILHRTFSTTGITLEKKKADSSALVSLRTCAECGELLPETAKFCPNCAQPIR